MTRCGWIQGLLAVGLLAGGSLCADEPEPRTVLQNIDNPSGIAVHPETGHYFIAARPGVIRVYREEGERKFSRKREIGRYPTDIYGKGPMYDIGPLGVCFLDNDHLIVTDGSRPDGQELIRVYRISATPPDRATPEENATYTLGPIGPSEASNMGEGNFYAGVVANGALYATSNGDDTKGWIVRSVITDGKPGKLEPFIATKQALDVDAPCGITVNQNGDLVVSQMGEVNVPKDSLLTIYDAKTGQLKARYSTDLHDIIGLAYSPDGRLFAVDFAWMEESQGGLFELTIDGDHCAARKVVSLDKPTALAFDKDGSLLVTVFGTQEEGSERKPGKLLRIPKNQLK